MFRLWSRDQSIEATLKRIEHQVLDDVRLPTWASRMGWVAVTVVIATVITTWMVGHDRGIVPLVAAVLGVGAVFCSVVSLRRRRFRWIVAAAYLSGLSTLTGGGAFWWCQTSSAVATLAVSTGLSAVAAGTLTVVWLAVAIAPVKDSQPDMRRPSKRKWGVRESGDTITWPPPCAGPNPRDRR